MNALHEGMHKICNKSALCIFYHRFRFKKVSFYKNDMNLDVLLSVNFTQFHYFMLSLLPVSIFPFIIALGHIHHC